MEKVFELNPYHICVVNKIVNGQQCTLVWYVNDKKVSQMEAKVVEGLIKYLKNYYGELVVTRVKKHKFWDVNINIMEGKNVEIGMKEKLLETIESFGENIDEKETTPAYSHLFLVNKQSNQPDK